MKATNSMYRKSPRFDSVGAKAARTACHCISAACDCGICGCQSPALKASVTQTDSNRTSSNLDSASVTLG